MPPPPEAPVEHAGVGRAVRDPANPAAVVVSGCSRSKSNMATSRSKSTSVDDDGDDDDDEKVAGVDGQTDEQSKSNSDEKVRIGSEGNAPDVRSHPNRSSRMDDVVASSAGRVSVGASLCSTTSVKQDAVASGHPSPSSSDPGSSSSTDGDRKGVDGATAAADSVGSASERIPAASTARRVLRIRTERRRGGSRRRSDRESGAAVRTLARLSSNTRRRSRCSSSPLSDDDVETSFFSSSSTSDDDDVLFRFSWFGVTSYMTPQHAHTRGVNLASGPVSTSASS